MKMTTLILTLSLLNVLFLYRISAFTAPNTIGRARTLLSSPVYNSCFKNKKGTKIWGSSSRNNGKNDNNDGVNEVVDNVNSQHSFSTSRRNAINAALASGLPFVITIGTSARADDADGAASSSFADIAARASQIVKDIDKETTSAVFTGKVSDKSAYDFELPVEGQMIKFGDLIKQEYDPDTGSVKIRAIIVVNIKQDDPVARKTIPELISLATRFSRNTSTSSVAIVCCPTDQGYYEPDTSQLIRLKLASEYGYGINPATILTDKVNLLGTGALPFWRWLQNTCRTPAGLGRVQGNFEKYLVDGRTGQPLRRYPRKYSSLFIADDIQALIAGRSQLPPPSANWQEAWRQAAAEAERDTYRFEKGLNVFDQ